MLKAFQLRWIPQGEPHDFEDTKIFDIPSADPERGAPAPSCKIGKESRAYAPQSKSGFESA